MSANIKFKAWDIYNERMSDVLLIDFLNNIIDLSGGDIEVPLEQVRLLQYTDLEDKNGKRYCDGDLVRYKGEIYRLIKGSYCFELDGFYNSWMDNPSDFFSENEYMNGEIVGNIYENRNLVEEDE